MEFTPELLDELTRGCKTPGDVSRLYSQMLQHMINRSLQAELDAHLGHEPHDKAEPGAQRPNTRNGKSRKTVQSEVGDLSIETPRDRDGSFAPQLVKKRQVRLAGMEDKILTLYAKGMTTRDIESALVDLYGETLSHALIAQVTDAVLDEARAWQSRPLAAIYPIVWLDGIVVKVLHNKQVIMGVNLCGEKEVLGLWLAENVGAKFRPEAVADLDARIARMTTVRTARAWVYKEQLREILGRKQIHVVRTALRQWCTCVVRSKVAPMKGVAALVHRHLDGIVAWAQTRQANGFLEALNGLLQAAKRRARGFTRFETIKTVIFLVAGKLNFHAVNPHVPKPT